MIFSWSGVATGDTKMQAPKGPEQSSNLAGEAFALGLQSWANAPTVCSIVAGHNTGFPENGSENEHLPPHKATQKRQGEMMIYQLVDVYPMIYPVLNRFHIYNRTIGYRIFIQTDWSPASKPLSLVPRYSATPRWMHSQALRFLNLGWKPSPDIVATPRFDPEIVWKPTIDPNISTWKKLA